MGSRGKANLFEGALGFLALRHAVEVLRQHHVFKRGEVRNQVELLEHEAYRFATEAGKLRAVQRGGIGIADQDLSLGGLVEAAKDVEERGLAGAGRAHDGNPFAGVGSEADAIERAHFLIAFRGVKFRDASQVKEGLGHSPLRMRAGWMRQMLPADSAVATSATVTVRAAESRRTVGCT